MEDSIMSESFINQFKETLYKEIDDRNVIIECADLLPSPTWTEVDVLIKNLREFSEDVIKSALRVVEAYHTYNMICGKQEVYFSVGATITKSGVAKPIIRIRFLNNKRNEI
jgi:hypothetical protein